LDVSVFGSGVFSRILRNWQSASEDLWSSDSQPWWCNDRGGVGRTEATSVATAA